jgi:hypothetical protein
VTIRSTIAVAAALAILGTTPALAASKPSDTVTLAAKTKKHVVRARRRAPQGQIACDWSGCHRIPPNCRIYGTQYDWNGDPTGMDAVYCR